MRSRFVIGFICLVVGSGSCFAFSLPFFHSDKPKRPNVQTSETDQYAVFFALSGTSEMRANSLGLEKKWLEISYKLVCLGEEEHPKLFNTSGWVEVLFQDKEGFILARDPVALESLIGDREYYGYVWGEEKKVKKINRVTVRPLKATDIPSPPKDQAPVELTAPVPFPAELAAPLPATAVEEPALPAPVTNEDIQETLKQFENEIPDQITAPEPEEKDQNEEEN